MHCHTQNSIRFVVSLAGLALAFGSPLVLAQDKPDAKKLSAGAAMKPPAELAQMKGTIHWGYDPADKKFVELGVDSTGSYMHGTSDGPQGGTWVWNEDGMMMGKKMKSRTTVTQKTPDTTQVKFESEMEPGKWVPMGEDDCKKQR